MRCNGFMVVLAIAAVTFVGLQVSLADTHTWDAGSGDGLWTTATNWFPDQVPANGDTAIINNGDTVNGPNGNIATVTLNISGNSTLTRTGGGAIRLHGSTLTVASGSTLTGGFWDLNNAAITFEDGAVATMNDWEQKGVNTFTYNLSATGFTTLTPNIFRNDGNNPASPATLIADDTYTVDLANYTGGGGIITLMDFNIDGEGMDNAAFQNATLNVLNPGAHTARMYWDDATEAIKLNVDPTVTWDGGGGDGLWKTGTNWSGGPDNTAPVTGDTVTINNGDTVSWDGTTGQNMPSNLTVNLTGNSTWTATSVIRLNNATVTVESGSTLTSTAGAFWDLRNADITFEDGAIVTIDDWENKDINTFTFELGATGFSTLTPNNFRIGNGSLPGSIANATFIVDMADYTGGTGIIPLVDFGFDWAGMDNALFQTAGGLSILNPGQYIANLQWNDSTEAVELNIIAVIPEPSTLVIWGLGLLALAWYARRKRFRI